MLGLCGGKGKREARRWTQRRERWMFGHGQERIMAGQRGNLRAVAGICEFHSNYFERLQLNLSIIPWTSA